MTVNALLDTTFIGFFLIQLARGLQPESQFAFLAFAAFAFATPFG